LISNKEDYEAVRSYLIENQSYREIKTNSFVLLTPAGIEVDILPFGEIEINDEVKSEGTGPIISAFLTTFCVINYELLSAIAVENDLTRRQFKIN
jgi:hypothetical protein